MRRVWKFWVNVVAAFAPFFLEREIFENGISWLIDWLVVFCWNKFGIGVESFWEKKMTVILVEKETSFENNGLIKLEWYKQPQIKHVVVIVCWWCLFCFENRGEIWCSCFRFFERRSSIPMQLFYGGFHIDWVFWVNTTSIFLVIDGFSLSTSFGFFVQIDY